MKRLEVTVTPIMKKQSSFKPQTNTLYRYLSPINKSHIKSNVSDEYDQGNKMSSKCAKRKRCVASENLSTNSTTRSSVISNLTPVKNEVCCTKNNAKINCIQSKILKSTTQSLNPETEIFTDNDLRDLRVAERHRREKSPEVTEEIKISSISKKRKMAVRTETVESKCQSSINQLKNNANVIDKTYLNINEFEHLHFEIPQDSTLNKTINNNGKLKKNTNIDLPNENMPESTHKNSQNGENYDEIILEPMKNDQIKGCDEKLIDDSSMESPTKDLPTPEKKKISGTDFKNIVYSFHYNDFCKPYRKLISNLTPACCDPKACKAKHQNVFPQGITSLKNGQFLNILDNPLDKWMFDLCSAAFSVLRPELYFTGDVLRVLFDYILKGPLEHLMWDVKYVLSSHWEVHPPCLEHTRQFYLQLLGQPYHEESYFKNLGLAETGVLSYVINQLEKHYLSPEPAVSVATERECEGGSYQQVTEPDDCPQKITLELLEERYYSFKPLLDIELKEVMGALNDISENISEKKTSKDVKGLNKHDTLARLIVALELLVDILEADFLICVSKLKRYVSGDSDVPAVPVPLVKHFIDNELHPRLFKLYAKTTDSNLWIQLTRLIGVMAEHVHLFTTSRKRLWHYPDLHADCHAFSTEFFNILKQCEWSEEERLLRLRILSPPWLQLQLAMRWANTKLNVEMGSDLKALVEIIHMHVISPLKLEKDVKKIKSDQRLMKNQSKNLSKRALKRNQYGETLLHRLCKQKGSSMSEFYSVLALPETDVNAQDNYGWTSLHEAVGVNSVLKTKTLLQYQPPPGAKAVDLGAQNCQGSTPLHEAVTNNNLEICQLLLDYGGVCLLRKNDSEGITPLDLAKENAEIDCYFQRLIKTQELLNLSPDSILNLPEPIIQLLVLACDAFIADHHTWQVYRVMKYNEKCQKVTPKSWIVVDQKTLLRLKRDQDQFRKLRRILDKLAENPKNSELVRFWDSQFQHVLDNERTAQSTSKLNKAPHSMSQEDIRAKLKAIRRLLLDEFIQLRSEQPPSSPSSSSEPEEPTDSARSLSQNEKLTPSPRKARILLRNEKLTGSPSARKTRSILKDEKSSGPSQSPKNEKPTGSPSPRKTRSLLKNEKSSGPSPKNENPTGSPSPRKARSKRQLFKTET